MKRVSLFVFLSFFAALNAQNKKAPQKQKSVEAAKPFIAQFVGMNLDDAAMTLDEKLSPKGFSFSSVEDDKTYIFTPDFEKTDSIYNFTKVLKGSINNNKYKFTITLESDAERKVYSLSILMNDNEIHKILEPDKWKVIDKKDSRLILKSNNVYAFSYPGFLDISESETSIFKKPIDTLNYSSSFEENVDFANKILTDAGNTFVFAMKKEKNIAGGAQTFIYNNGFRVDVRRSGYNYKVSVTNDNIIALNHLVNKVQMAGFVKKYESKEGHKVYYKKGKTMLDISKYGIEFYHPDTDGFSNEITPVILNSIGNRFSDEKIRNEYLKDHFKHLIYDDGTVAIFGYGYGEYVHSFFSSDNTFRTNWGLKFLIDSHQNRITYPKDNLDALGLVSEDFKMKSGNFPHRTQFYDKTVYTANKTSKDIQDSAKKLADQKAEAERAQREIQENERKAQQNAELTKGLRQISDELIKLYQK